MDSVFQAFLSWQFLLLSLSVAAIVFITKTIVEYIMADLKIEPSKIKVWQNLILPLFPLGLGALVGFLATQFPFPDSVSASSARVAFGLVGGLFSGLVYRVMKSMLADSLKNVITSTVGDMGTSITPPTVVVNETTVQSAQPTQVTSQPAQLTVASTTTIPTVNVTAINSSDGYK